MGARRRRQAPMPASAAGLLRFFEEETEGVKVKPEVLVAAAIGLIVVVAISHLLF